jgi:hypothetical protein
MVKAQLRTPISRADAAPPVDLIGNEGGMVSRPLQFG